MSMIISIENKSDDHFLLNNKRVKGTVRDFLPRNILRMGFFQAPYSVSVSFSNFASNSGKYCL
jgi:hypothetical protein